MFAINSTSYNYIPLSLLIQWVLASEGWQEV